jgi:hypothetical protein
MTDVATMQTLLLTLDTWDLCADSNGNIAIASPPYAVAQDVASAIQTFESEVYYDKTLGVDYGEILGQQPSLNVVTSDMETASLAVPGVVTANCAVSSFTNGDVVGQVEFTDSDHNTGTVGL